MLSNSERTLLTSLVRLNMFIMGAMTGIFAGLLLWFATAILLLRGGPNVGQNLSLLGVFLPGYEVSWAGAWIGLFWGLILGGLSGAILYGSYAATLSRGLSQPVLETPSASLFRPPVFLISGTALGLALGGLAALQLLITTNWLVWRGTAHLSSNAALLTNYLPGYSVSFNGSLVGAAQLFGFVFIAAMLFSAAYNTVAKARNR